MVKGGFAKFSKVILFVVNILFWALGCAILGFGIYAEIQRKDNEKIAIIGELSAFGPLAFIIGGVLILVIGFSGCCGAIKEHRGLLILYSVLVLVIFAIEIGVGIFGFVQHNDLENIVTKGMRNTLDEYDPDRADLDATKAWDSVQNKVKCCGVSSADDWENATLWAPIFNNSVFGYPSSCCNASVPFTVGVNQTYQVCYNNTMSDFHNAACFDEILSELKSYWKPIAGIGLGVAIFELLVIIMACALQHAIKKSEYTAV